jgi:hypothetical protein
LEVVIRLFEYFTCKKNLFHETAKDEMNPDLRKFFNTWNRYCREKRLKVGHAVFCYALGD